MSFQKSQFQTHANNTIVSFYNEPKFKNQEMASLLPIDVAFGRLLKEQRKTSGFTQADLALRSGIAKSFVSRMERGMACPTIDTVFRIANAFDVQPESFVKRLRQINEDLGSSQLERTAVNQA